MVRNVDRVGATLFDLTINVILVNLRRVALLQQDYREGGLAKATRLEVEHARLGARHLEFDRIPFERLLRFFILQRHSLLRPTVDRGVEFGVQGRQWYALLLQALQHGLHAEVPVGERDVELHLLILFRRHVGDKICLLV